MFVAGGGVARNAGYAGTPTRTRAKVEWDVIKGDN